jgi:putative ABC transport system permease protein
MSFCTAIRVAIGSIHSKKGQCVLTCLGMMIGIGSVIAVTIVGAGARGKLDASLETIGKNLILIRPGSRSSQGDLCDLAPLTIADVEAIGRGAGRWIVGVAPSQMTQRTASSAHGNYLTWFAGSLPAVQHIRNWQVICGRFYNDNDVRQASPVCLLGQTARRQLFPKQTNPVGEWIRVGHVRLRIIGILGPKGRAPTGGDQDDQISVPITTLQRRLSADERISMILTTARSDDLLDRAKEEITRVMSQRHHHGPQVPDGFDVSTVREIAELAETFTRTMQHVVVVIASISLLIGGIGIMNIMLASVTQRTREIGIRMAVGARPADILIQFLTEAVVLAILGGTAGIALGMGGGTALARLAGWPIIVSQAGVATAFLVSAGIGILFGYYPASKAARLEPMIAIRCD